MPNTVLICDDEQAIAWALSKACEKQGYRVQVAASAEDALAKAKADPPDAAFLDVRLPGMDGLTALAELRALAPAVAVIVITAHGNLSTAVKAVEGGAFDYLAKPFDLDQAMDALKRALQRPGPANPPPAARVTDDELIGRSGLMQSVFKRVALVSPTTACVLITGESGTGKELVARAVHANSPRRDKPFLPIHVAALNPNLVESELFGHARGSFTGADKAKSGLIALADGGTVFLDELGDIPLAVQAKLLRVLERQEVLPVGGAEAQAVDVRIVSATNADLSEAVAAGRFRHDLFFRLNVYPIHLPALRDRRDDIPTLAEHFLRTFTGSTPQLTPEAVTELKSRAWPGNVRELKNAMEYAAIVARGGAIRPDHLPPASSLGGSGSLRDRLAALVRDWTRERVRTSPGEPADLYPLLLNEVEPALLGEVMEQLNGNRLVAARWLGLARATVRKLIRKHHLEPDATDDDGEE
jgi:two-component system, NtrC family, nitrogen regulation response regulator GlnG